MAALIKYNLSKYFRPAPRSLRVGQEISRGAYGTVHLGQLDRQPVAVKKIHNILFEAARESSETFDNVVTKFENECQLLEDLKHPHVVGFLGAYYDVSSQEPILVMERMKEDLRTLIDRERKLDLKRQFQICLAIARGLEFLHSRSPPAVHRDLNDKNVMLTEEGNVKIGDLGESKLKPSSVDYFNSAQPGAIPFMPPEALREKAHYTEKIDLFSLGVLMLEIATCHHPSVTLVGIGVQSEIVRHKTDLSRLDDGHPLKPFVLQCLKDDYKDRPSAVTVRQFIGKRTELEEAREMMEMYKSRTGQLEEEMRMLQLKDSQSIGIRNHGRAESRLAVKLKPWCAKTISTRGISIYELPHVNITQDYTNKIATVQVGPRSARFECSLGKVLMVVGATGVGKTTLINAMVNYLFGVEWEDDFRFKMIVEEAAKDQSKSVTKWITAYTIPAQEGSPVPYTLTIIDTPGFGDTEGIERDKLIVKQVKELFSKEGRGGIDQLHGIGFVAQAPLARLTHTQRYIFDFILAIFGKDVEKNVFMMTTFADRRRPPVLEAVKASNISYEAAFKFNNSVIYSENDDVIDRLFWEMGMSSLLNFFTSLGKMAAISLQLTRQVLDEREHLEAIMKGLQDQIKKGLNIIEELHQIKEVVKKHEADIERNKEFEISVTLDEPHKVLLKAGEYTTNCLKCSYTCHFPCYTQDRQQSPAMRGGYCTVCPGKCHWTKHYNNQYRFEMRERTEKRTLEDVKKKYYDAKSGKSKYESTVSGLEQDLERKGAEVYENIKQVRECVLSLDKITLKPNPLSDVEYIELMIESEEQQKRPGFLARIATLTKVKKQAELLSKVTKGNIERLSITGKDEESWRFLFGSC